MTEFSERDRQYMERALKLASLGNGYVNPNPLVGAAVVKDRDIVGEGYHEEFGGPHAEINALDQAGEEATDATMYVTLEPCTHYGKTPPCTDAIIASGVSKVVIAAKDPNPDVSGGGEEVLEEAGVEVNSGLLEDKAVRQNEIFFGYVRNKRPFVLLKLAMTADGKIATKTGDSRWITAKKARKRVHELRARYSGIAVGRNTLIADNPKLTVRDADGPDGTRFILTSSLEIPRELNVLDLESPARTIFVTGKDRNDPAVDSLRDLGAEVWKIGKVKGGVDPEAFLKKAADEDHDSVLIEGGGELAWSFLKLELVDKVNLFYAPKIAGGREAVPSVGGAGVENMSEAIGLEDVAVERYGQDFCLVGYPEY